MSAELRLISKMALVLVALLPAPQVHGQSIITIEHWPLLDLNSRAMWSAGFLDATYVRYSHEARQGVEEQRGLASSMVRCLGKVTPEYFSETIIRDALRLRRAWSQNTRMFVLAEQAITQWCLF
jgi:hypothetical protein